MNDEKVIQFTEDIATLKTKMEFVKNQVCNHIPTQIRETQEKNEEEHVALHASVVDIRIQMAKWSGGIITALTIIQLIINKYL